MLDNLRAQSGQIARSKSSRPGELDGIEPIFGGRLAAFDVDVRRLVVLQTVKRRTGTGHREEPWALHCQHARLVRETSGGMAAGGQGEKPSSVNRLAPLPASGLLHAHIPNRGAHPFPSLLGKVARSAGWGVGRCFEPSRTARTSHRTYIDPVLHPAPHPAFGHLPRFAEKGGAPTARSSMTCVHAVARAGRGGYSVRRFPPSTKRSSPAAGAPPPFTRPSAAPSMRARIAGRAETGTPAA
jgi:hypothetical protein